ncbi:hypothetical protein [Polymorphobacter megasporae]|uniref:hypothetical protein n=1 Tax=Glacieibacterium megasporae TaxID=2835787 RepID=UPI001C1E4A6D|nr:hypothetical protein [Polymorphobacter megasporae]UAJ12474.1 hypothetical protein KTC28_21970 [Polymorphobacter megasporae]
MQLSSFMTVSAAEDFLRHIYAGTVGKLQIPTRARHHAAGGEAAFVQAVSTWANEANPAELVSYAEGPVDEVQIERLVSRLHGLVGILVADTISSIRGPDLTEVLRKAALERLSLLQSATPEDGSRGPQLEIVCFDHLAKSHPRSFYAPSEQGVLQVRRLPAFNLFAAEVLKELVPTALSRGIPEGFTSALGGALHELFRNTEEHGRVNDRGDVPTKSVRGFHARRHSITPKMLPALAAEAKPFSDYFSRLRPARAGNRDIQLIELSVFDTGPGMAASLSARPLTSIDRNEELLLVRRCFGKNVSRKSISSAGLGLPTVIDLLRERNGFLRLRTGRLSLFSDLGLEEQRAFGELPELRDWADPGGRIAPIAGTLFTLLFPLGA